MSIRKILNKFKPTVGLNNLSNREYWLEITLQSIPENSRILDAGAGTQQYRKYCKHLKYVSQDFGKYDGEGDGIALQIGKFDYGKLDIVSDIISIPEPDASFDAIMCVEVIEHLENPVLAIQEFSRLLKPNGHLIITAPFCSLTHFAPYHFSTGFNKYWYEIHLNKFDFKIVELDQNGNYFEYLGQEINRLQSVADKYANSKPTLIEKISMRLIQNMLLRFSKKDNQSANLLCFGYHVHAIKK